MRFVSVDLIFKDQRKAQNFTIYPVLKTENQFLIQSDKRIGRVDLESKKIYLSKSRSNGGYGPDLCEARGAKYFDLSNEQIEILTLARDKMAGLTNDKKQVLIVG